MIRIFVILGVFFALCYFLFVIYLVWNARRQRKAMKQALNDSRLTRDKIWKEADAIEDMVKLYMNMVCKHGPHSEEAKAFRFGTNSPLMKSLHEEEAMRAFNQQANLIDETWRQQKNQPAKGRLI